MIGNKQAELIKAIKNHKCCGKSDGSSDNEQGGGNTPSGDIGYEEIYQFYVRQLKAIMPPGSEAVFPDTFNDIINVENTVYPNNTFGIWKVNIENAANIIPVDILFSTVSEDGPEDCIVFRASINPNAPVG